MASRCSFTVRLAGTATIFWAALAFWVLTVALFPVGVNAQSEEAAPDSQADTETPAPLQCTYSCPLIDLEGKVLVPRVGVISFDSPYSIFDCIYGVPQTSEPTHRCQYNKDTGLLALSPSESTCPLQAVPCPNLDSGSDSLSDLPQFSAQGVYETPAWIETGKEMMWIKEHPRQFRRRSNSNEELSVGRSIGESSGGFRYLWRRDTWL